MASKYPCVVCRKDVAATKNHRYRSHSDGNGEPCEMSSAEIPEHVLANGAVDGKQPPDVPVEGVDYAGCARCGRKVKLTRLGYYEPHDSTLRGGDRCPSSGTRLRRKVENVDLPDTVSAGATGEKAVPDSDASRPDIPESSTIVEETAGDARAADLFVTELAATLVAEFRQPPPTDAAASQASAEAPTVSATGKDDPAWQSAPDASSGVSTGTSSPVSSTSTPGISSGKSTPFEPAEPAPFSLGISVSSRFLQPFSPFLQPGVWVEPKLVFLQPPEYTGPVKAEPMGDLAKELATKIKETFYSYSNRKTTDNRSAQTTLGPSEIGTPCDRRLAMSLMGVAPVNPGGDGWAAFVGTCTHVGMGEVYTFADAGTGRYAVEMPVFLGIPTVPRGTTDLLDRRDGTVVDWKVMGAYSLKKFKLEGPSDTYRTQAHVYGLGAEKGGEKVRNVAIVGLPRAGSSLDEMHVWTEKYDRKFAQAALDRVEKIANQIQEIRRVDGLGSTPSKMATAQVFEPGDDCRYCSYFLKGDKEMTRGCPGS